MYDIIVIGSGPAGEGAAISAAKNNLKVALVELNDRVGGNCTFKGTIPSKTLRHIVGRSIEFSNSQIFNPNNNSPKIHISDVLRHVNDVLDKQVARKSNTFLRNNIEVIQGLASIVDETTIKITPKSLKPYTLKTKNIILATGSSPFTPADINFSHKRIYDSNTILEMTEHPRSMIIYGAGVIGSEYASIFQGLGVKVTLINTRERLLSFLDDEVSAALSYHFIDQGINVKHNECYDVISAHENLVEVKLKSNKVVTADCLLFANGRAGNTKDIGLDNVGIRPDERGLISVNDNYQTNTPNIYAIGDVIGYPSLASTSFDQGRTVGEIIALKKNIHRSHSLPSGIYTIPDISCIGKTEQELTRESIPYEIGRAHFKHLARSQITNYEIGFLKLIFCPQTKKLLGIHCFGERSSEIIHIGQAIMDEPNATIEYFANTTFNYPTMAEAYRVAALNGLNRIRK